MIARGNVSGRGGVWPRGELRRIVKRWKKMEYVSRWICVVRISDARGNVSGRGGVWPRGELNRDMGMTMKIT